MTLHIPFQLSIKYGGGGGGGVGGGGGGGAIPISMGALPGCASTSN